MNEVNFVPIRILIKKRRRSSIIKRLIVSSILLFAIATAILLPRNILRASKRKELIAYKEFQIYQNALNSKNKIKEQQLDKIQELKKGMINIGSIVKAIDAIKINNIKVININYQTSHLLIKGTTINFNAIIHFGKAIKAICLITSADLIEVDFDQTNGVYNFDYKVTL